MINRVVLVGRLTRDAEVKVVGVNNVECARFTVACDRVGEGADFINCVAWKQSARFLGQYAHKGDVVCVDGSISTGSYQNKDGQTVYTTDVTAQSVRLVSGKKEQSEEFTQPRNADAGNNQSLVIDSDDLPFY